MTDPSADALVTLDDIRAAAQRLHGTVVRTPLLEIGDGSWAKPESLQPTGAFKLRGAYNAIVQLDAERRAAGVVTDSSGNHGQAVARVARLLGIRAVVVMPSDAPRVKVRRVEEDGAEVVLVGPSHAERSARSRELTISEGLTRIPSADSREIIAGQGTVGLEVVEQLREIRVEEPPTVLVPIGQGGLAAGVATAVKELRPGARAFGVEPELAADTRDSLAAARIVSWPAESVARTIADGMRMQSPAPLPFAHLRRYLDGVLTVSEDQIGAAMARAADDLRLVLEPSGATTLAAHDVHRPTLGEGPVVVVLSGGNVDPDRYEELVRAGRRLR